MWFKVDDGLSEEVKVAAKKTIGAGDDFDPDIRVADQRFGDFQANGVFSYAKKMQKNPYELAKVILNELKTHEKMQKSGIDISVSGAGFISFKLSNKFLTQWLKKFKSAEDFSGAASWKLAGKTIVIDYSSPNTAKQMHVGHLRSMNIGESIQRILRFCGANIIRDNHVGDWGTQFGILIMAIKHFGIDLSRVEQDSAIETLEDLYKQGTALAKSDEKFLDDARSELVKLQNGDETNFAIWEKINEISYRSFEKIYKQMDIEFDYVLGESFYRDEVDKIYSELTAVGIAQEDDGALVVFHPEHERFKSQPFIIRKSDRASNYATTDLATMLYRVEKFHADEVICVTDGRQQDHFQQLFMTVEKWFKATNRVVPEMRHVWFGTILGDDGKAIKTRTGTSVKLKDLINESIERSKKILTEKNSDFSKDDIEKIAEIIGIDSIKYADLMSNRTNDYVFALNRMVSLDGNTAAYLLYAATRIRSIFNKLGLEHSKISCNFIDEFDTPEERTLARKIMFFPLVLTQVIDDLRPHFLCTYLFELTCEYSSFYSANKVISDLEDVQNRRLTLCARTLTILEIGFHLLGMKSVERM